MTAPRAHLTDLPYALREVARIADHWQSRQSTEQVEKHKRKRRRRKQLSKMNIPT
ncbi:MAG: hypothetical protein ACOCV2_13610 [Persicimonas sp.]